MNVILEKTVQELGFTNIESFVKQKLTETLLQDIAKFESQVKSFEHKYQMDFETYEKTYIHPKVEEDIDKWHDDMYWDAALHSLNHAKHLLQVLEQEGLTSYYGIKSKKFNNLKQKADNYNLLQK